MNSTIFNKGDILIAEHRQLKKGYHYIIYIEGHSKKDFIGAMITHSDKHENIKMNEEHFDNDSRHRVKYDKTFLAKGKFIKPETWGPYKKVGQLTAKGIEFVNTSISDLVPEPFENYYRRNKLLEEIRR